MSGMILALVVASTMPAGCNWNSPGANPYRPGDIVAALNDYTLDPQVKAKLAQRMGTHSYDEMVKITRQSVTSEKHEYGDLRDMHYGAGKFCAGPVVRDAWKPEAFQYAMVYCEGETCVVVPLICNNVSLVTRKHDDDVEVDGSPVPSRGPEGTPSPDAPPTTDEVISPTPSPYTFEGGGGGGGFGGGFGGGGYAGGGGGGSGGGGGGGGITPPSHPPVVGPPVVVPPIITPPVSPVPEPSSLLMMLVGVIAMFGYMARKRG